MSNKLLVSAALIALLGGCSVPGISNAPVGNVTNPAEKPVETPAEKTAAEKPSSGKILDLSGRGLTRIPDETFKETGIEELDVSGNELTGSIQAEIRQLQNLKVLRASGNRMTGVPAEIGQLEQLEILDLSNNLLTGLPYEIGNLKNLKTLDVKGNQYSELDLAKIVESLPADVEIIK